MADTVLFSGLPREGLLAVADSMTPLHVPPGTDIIRQGDTDAHTFYVLEAGRAEVYKSEGGKAPALVKEYAPGRWAPGSAACMAA